MRSAFRHGATVLALVGVVGLAAASQLIDQDATGRSPTEEHVAQDVMRDVTWAPLRPTLPDVETTGVVDRAATPRALPLSDEQLGFIFLGVMNLPDTSDVELTLDAAAAVPDDIALQDLPAMVIHKIPLLRDHKFVKLDDRILVVRPADRMVVSEIPRFRILP